MIKLAAMLVLTTASLALAVAMAATGSRPVQQPSRAARRRSQMKGRRNA